MHTKSLGKNAIYNIAYRVLNVIFPLISTAYISRVLLAEGIGRVSAVANNISYFMVLATLGIPVYGLREIAKNKEDSSKRSKLFSELIVMNFILTVCVYSIYIILINNYAFFGSEKLLYEIYGFTILLNIINVDWLFQGLEEYGYIAARSTIIKIISIMALFVLVKNKYDIYKYAIIQVVATTGNYFFNIIKSKDYISFKLKQLNISAHLKPLLFLALGSVSTELYAKMDITMLDVMKSSDVVGYYSSSQRVVNLVVTILVAVTAVFLPRLSFLFEKNKEQFNIILGKGLNLMITVSIPACFGLILVSRPLVLTLLGEDFKKASTTVAILAFMIPLKCIGDLICYQVMMCARRDALLMKSYFVTMLINLINNVILIPYFGAEGAAVASVISEVLAFVIVLHFSKDYFKVNGIKLVFIKTVICTSIMSIVICMITFMQIPSFLKLIFEVCVGGVVYIFCGIIIGHEVIHTYIHEIKKIIKGCD